MAARQAAGGPDGRDMNSRKGGDPMSTILYGPILGKIRRGKMIKAEVVARHLGISTTTYSQIETGRRSASYERVTAICDELGISPTRLNELLTNEKRR